MPFKKKDNRRKNSRVSLCRLVKIRFSKASAPAELTSLFDLSEAGMRFHVTDLSDTGFQLSAPGLERGQSAFKSLSGIKKGDTLFLSLNLDPQCPEISVLGRIAWVVREATKSDLIRLRAGIEFVDITESDLKLIQVYVSAFQTR
jgi:c-di-GMP-binding flagellar brake protein YcgR